MSIHRRRRSDGDWSYQVKWRDDRDEWKSKTFRRKKHAEAFEDEIKRNKRLGSSIDMDAGKETLAEFGKEWWRAHAEPNLRENTRKRYASLWDCHVLPRLGAVRLRDISPKVVDEFKVALLADGASAGTVRKVLILLQGVLRLATTWERIPRNPVISIKKPPQQTQREIKPLTPSKVEAIRQALIEQSKETGLRDATFVSIQAYGGCRPGEALGLVWGKVRQRTLWVRDSNSPEADTKTGNHRTVDLLGPLAKDLTEWRLFCGRPEDDDLVFPKLRSKDGPIDDARQKWTKEDYDNWRDRVYGPIAEEVGASKYPYDLRHSFVSLLIHEGRSIPEVARQAGHSVQTCLDNYAHVFEEFDPAERVSAEEEIQRARKPHIQKELPSKANGNHRAGKVSLKVWNQERGSELLTSYPQGLPRRANGNSDHNVPKMFPLEPNGNSRTTQIPLKHCKPERRLELLTSGLQNPCSTN